MRSSSERFSSTSSPESVPLAPELESQIFTFRPELVRFCLKNLGGWTAPEATAEDIVQAALLKAVKYMHTFEEGTNLRAWLFRITKNALFDYKRKEKAQLSFRAVNLGLGEKDEKFVAALDPGSSPEALVMRKDFPQLLARIPLDEAQVFRLFCQGLAYKEIAAILKIPFNTVGTRLLRARKNLARLVRPDVEAN